MNRVQQGHEKILIGQHDGGVNADTSTLLMHEFHLVESLFCLPNGRWHSHHSQGLFHGFQRGNRHRPKTLAVAIDEQGSRVMRRLVKHRAHSRIIPPEISLVVALETFKKLNLGSREDTKADQN